MDFSILFDKIVTESGLMTLILIGALIYMARKQNYIEKVCKKERDNSWESIQSLVSDYHTHTNQTNIILEIIKERLSNVKSL